MFSGNDIYLRPLEPEDVDLLYLWENNTDIWVLSHTLVPFSKHLLKIYAESTGDLYLNKQLRLVICQKDGKPVGTIDLFEFDGQNRRAGIGILIADEESRQKGFASQALTLMIDYCFVHLGLHQLYCNIMQDNEKSIALFEKLGFEKTGIKKNWLLSENQWMDVYFYQLLNSYQTKSA